MKNNWITRFIASIILILLILGLSTKPVLAKNNQKTYPKATVITLGSVKDQSLGDPFQLFGSIKDVAGKPVPDEHIQFTIDKVYLGQSKSDIFGNFILKVSKDYDAGLHTITATFKGSHIYKLAEASILLQINPTDVLVQTVPIIPGVPFLMAGQKIESDQNGTVRFQLTKVGTYRLEVLVKEFSDPSLRIEFGRWEDENYQPYKEIKVPTNAMVQVGLNVYQQVSQKFVDLSGYPVLPQRITEYTIKSAQGDVFTFKDNLSHWIPSSRIARRITGLEETKLLYSMIKVNVDGSNVVNQAQQRYFASPNGSWQTSLLLYSMQLHVRDGLFDSPVGNSAEIKYPNGQITSYPLDSAGNAQIHSLARGLYTVSLVDIHGITTKTPVALSRDQVVNIKVITFIDIGIVCLLGLTLGFGLFFLGRPWLIGPLFRRFRKLKLDPQSYSYHEN